MTSRNPKLPRRTASGNALIEFVLVLPLLLLLLLGAIDWGFYFMVRETVINATREGARAGSVATSDQDPVALAQAAVENYLQNALGAAYKQTPTVTTAAIGTTGSTGIKVRLADYPVVPGRPTTSITGFGPFTRVPTTITAETNMRLESPPSP